MNIMNILALHSGEDSDSEIRDVDAAVQGDGDEHDSLEGHAFPTSSSSPTASGQSVSSSSTGTGGAKSRPMTTTTTVDNAFTRLSFPRDSGCFASNENLKDSTNTSAAVQQQQRASPAASDRSSHSGVSSHPESGMGSSRATTANGGSSDEENTLLSMMVTPRSAEQAAKSRSLRDRRAVNVDELEKQLQKDDDVEVTVIATEEAAAVDKITMQFKTGLRLTSTSTKKLTHSETMELIHARRFREQSSSSSSSSSSKPTLTNTTSSFDALVEKYGKKSSVTTKPSFESQFISARSVFEKNEVAASIVSNATARAASVSASSSPVKNPCRKFAESLVATSVD
jgi:hypothetical protein